MSNDDAGVKKDDQQAPVDTGVENKDQQSTEADIDYKALYEKEVEEKENYKKALTQKRQLRKKPEETVEEEENDDDKPLTRKDLHEVVSIVNQSKSEQLLSSITDANKRNLIKFHLENSIKLTGNAEADFAKALAITDAPKLQKINKELARAAENKPQSSSSAGSSSEKTVEKQTISPELKIALENKARKIGVDPQKFVDKFLENKGKTPVLG